MVGGGYRYVGALTTARQAGNVRGEIGCVGTLTTTARQAWWEVGTGV